MFRLVIQMREALSRLQEVSSNTEETTKSSGGASDGLVGGVGDVGLGGAGGNSRADGGSLDLGGNSRGGGVLVGRAIGILANARKLR